MFYEHVPCWTREVPEHLKTEEMCNNAVAYFSCPVKYVADHLKTEEMCRQTVSNNPYMLGMFQIILKQKKCVISSLK